MKTLVIFSLVVAVCLAVPLSHWRFGRRGMTKKLQHQIDLKNSRRGADSSSGAYCEGSNKEDDLQKEMHIAALKAHNELRSKHGAPAMCLDSQLNDEAQEWAEELVSSEKLKHASDTNGAGENLFLTRNSALSITIPADTATKAVNSWYDEIKDYDFSSCQSSNGRPIGHFTQVVWKDSIKLGCGMADGPVGHISPTVFVVVCRYKSHGNYQGQYCGQVGKLI